MARIEVEAGDGVAEGGALELGAEPLQVGTSRRCQLNLREQGISFVHAIISRDGDGFTVLAKPSAAGTAVNGEPLRSGATRRLAPGDRLTFGSTTVRFVDDAPPAAPALETAPPAVEAAPPAVETAPAALAAEVGFHVPARLEVPPPAPASAPVVTVDDGAEALLRRLEAAEGERDALRALARDLEADAADARRALEALAARQEALQAERDALRREVARLEAAARLGQPTG